MFGPDSESVPAAEDTCRSTRATKKESGSDRGTSTHQPEKPAFVMITPIAT